MTSANSVDSPLCPNSSWPRLSAELNWSRSHSMVFYFEKHFNLGPNRFRILHWNPYCCVLSYLHFQTELSPTLRGGLSPSIYSMISFWKIYSNETINNFASSMGFPSCWICRYRFLWYSLISNIFAITNRSTSSKIAINTTLLAEAFSIEPSVILRIALVLRWVEDAKKAFILFTFYSKLLHSKLRRSYFNLRHNIFFSIYRSISFFCRLWFLNGHLDRN